MEHDGFASGEPPAPDEIRTLDAHLTLFTRIALYAVAALSLAALISTWNEITAFDEFRDTGTAEAILAIGQAEQRSGGFVTLVLWVGVATGVLTILWWHHAYRAMLGARPRGVRWSPGWAVGGWFIPLGNIVIAKLVLDEIDRVSRAVVDGTASWRDRARTAVTGWWWGFWVGGLAIGIYGTTLVTSQVSAPSFDPGSYRTGLVALVVAHGCSVVAGFCGAASLRLVGERLHRV